MKNILFGKNKNIRSLLFYIIPLGIIINMLLSWKYAVCYTPDSYKYIEISKDLPRFTDSIFPLFYPVLIRFGEFLTGNYDMTIKLINLFAVIFILFFVRLKKFYWKEIWIMMTFSSFQHIFPMAWTESTLLVFLIVYSYYNYKFLKNEITAPRFFTYHTLLLVAMLLIKYSSIFILLSCLIFALFLMKRSKNFSKYYFISSLITLLFFILYLFFNFYLTGKFTGVRGIPSHFNYLEFMVNSIKRIPLTYDPLGFSLHRMSMTMKNESGISYINKFPYLLSYLFSFFCLYFFVSLKDKRKDFFTLFCVITSFTFLICTFIVGGITKIDVLDYRLLLCFYVFLLIGVIHCIRLNTSNYHLKLIFIGVFSLLVFTFSIIL